MPIEAFKRSESLSLGVELELQLINLSDFDLSESSPDVLELLRRKPFPGSFSPELTESMIEVATHVHTNYTALLNQLTEIRRALSAAGERLNIGICGGGAHPFQLWSDRRISKKPRYQKASLLYGYLAEQFTIFGQHVHVGCKNGDEALFLLHALSRYIPHFIALSASSPFVQGKDTMFHSARLNSVFAFPLSGRAPFLLKWEDFESYFLKMEQTGIVSSMKDFYWDLRPKPEYGTIELRVCDTPLSVERAAALACYLQALCLYLLEHNEPNPLEDDYLVYNYNRFQGCRFGLEGTLIHPKSHEQFSLKEDILATIRRIQPHAEALHCMEALEQIVRIVQDGNDASYLRQAYRERGSVEGAIDSALQCFLNDSFSPTTSRPDAGKQAYTQTFALVES